MDNTGQSEAEKKQLEVLEKNSDRNTWAFKFDTKLNRKK